MIRSVRAFVGAFIAITAIATNTLHADTVQLTLRDGRLTLVATNATPAEIFEAWSRAGGVLVLNADRIPSTPVTLRLEDVTEEQALETLLRQVSGYLARRRTAPPGAQSIFDRIVILPTPQMARETTPPATPLGAGRPGAVPASPQPTRPATAQPPAATAPPGIPQAPGVTRLVGPDGQPVEDDQTGAPPPYNGGDAPPRPTPSARPVPGAQPPPQQQPQQPQPSQPPTSAPAGVPVPGMIVPAPQRSTPGQMPTPGQAPTPG